MLFVFTASSDNILVFVLICIEFTMLPCDICLRSGCYCDDVSRRSAQMCSIIFIGFVVFCTVYCSNPYNILVLASCTVVRSWCSEQQRGRAGCCTSSKWCTSISSSSAFIRSCQQLQGSPLCLQTLNKIDQCFLLWQEQEAGNCILTHNTIKCEFEIDFRSNEHCLSNSEIRPEVKVLGFRFQRWSKPSNSGVTSQVIRITKMLTRGLSLDPTTNSQEKIFL